MHHNVMCSYLSLIEFAFTKMKIVFIISYAFSTAINTFPLLSDGGGGEGSPMDPTLVFRAFYYFRFRFFDRHFL